MQNKEEIHMTCPRCKKGKLFHNPTSLEAICDNCTGHPEKYEEAAAMEKLLEEFDRRFPAFDGVGAMFPIFVENPNREHVKEFFLSYIRSLESSNKELEEKLRVAKEALEKLQDGHGCSLHQCGLIAQEALAAL
jgi:hypothetical protein